MSKENKTLTSVFDMISGLQRILFYITLVIIPWFVIPLPYDSTEILKSVVFIFLSSFIILLEIIKWIWDGKISIRKSSFDKVFLLLFLSFLISGVFAKDSWIGIWGYDGRMGGGLLVMVFLFLLFYLGRGFFQKRKDLILSGYALSIGILILQVLSVLSVFDINVFGWVPFVKEFFVVGLPLSFSFKEILVISGTSILLNIFLVISSLKEKKYQGLLFPIVALITSFILIPIFSVNRGALLPILLFVLLVPVCLVLWIHLKKSQKSLPVLLLVLGALVLTFSIGFQYESFRESILGESFSTLTPVTLGADISWVVASSSIVDNFARGLVGLGNDSFAIAYHLYRPGGNTVSLLGNTTFVNGSNEIFTTLANRGLIGTTVWVLLGIVYLRLLIKQVTESKGDRKPFSFILAINGFFIFLASFFIPFSFLMYFLLFVSTLLLVAFNSKEEDNEEFVLKFWAVNIGGDASKDINKTMEGINWFFTIVVTLLTTGGLILLFTRTMSLAYVVRAEAYNVEKNREYTDYEAEEIDFEVREEYLVRMANYYDKALEYNQSNPYINRKASLVSVEIIRLLSEKAQEDQDNADAILSEISVWKNTAIDLSKKATNTSPLMYANWNTRASVYLGFINTGLSGYEEDALNALQASVNLNPLDYDAYYKAGQIYVIKEDYEKALSALNTAININNNNVFAILLAGAVYREMGETEDAIAYFTAAKELLELNEITTGEIYDGVMASLEELGADTTQEEIDLKDEEPLIEKAEEDLLVPNNNDENLLTE